MGSRSISPEELRAHKTKKDVWIAVEGKVYDVTRYLDDHPGGEEILLEVGGSDATEAFEDVGHSADAKEAMEALYVGNLGGYEAPSAKTIFKSSKVPSLPEISTKRSPAIYIILLAISACVGIFGVCWQYGSFIIDTLSTRSAGVSWFTQGAAVQLLVSLVAASSLTMLVTAFIKIKATLDLDYEVEHYKPYRPQSRRFQGAPSYRDRPTALDATAFNSFPLVSRQQISPNSYLFSFGLPHPQDSLELPVGRHVVIQADIDGKSVSRSYTPSSRNEDLGVMDLVVKVYPTGLMGNYMLNLPIGKAINVRGPAGRFRYNRFLCSGIGCIAGGSGITPMLQIVRAICEDPDDETVISLLYANQTEDDILMRKELESLARKYSSQFSVKFWLDRPPQEWRGGTGFVTKEDIQQNLPAIEGNSKYLICGPPPMVNAMKRNLVALGCAEPKAVTSPKDQIYIF